MHRKKQIIAIGVTLIVFAVSLLAVRLWETRRFTVQTPETRAVTISTDHRRPIGHGGVTYVPRPEIRTYLVMGIDKDGPAESSGAFAGGGQADFILVLAVNPESKTQQLLMLNRDTVTQIPVLGMMGSVVGYEQKQLAVSHFYGDGRHKSCMNTADAVSHLLANQPIDGYVALNMGGIPVLNDAVGGVTVTIEDDFSGTDATLVKGETITLNGRQAETFVRARMSMKDDPTNLARMRRQEQYMSALLDAMAGKDSEQFLRIYETAKPYVVTNLGSGELQTLAGQLQSYRALPVCQVSGHTELVEGVTAFYADADSLTEAIVRVFYRPE